MLCEMCSGPNALFKVEIEGSRLTVCEKCARYGKVVGKAAPAPTRQNSKVAVSSAAQKRTESIQVIKSDYSILIRKARDKLGITQAEFAGKIMEKESMLHKIESGHLKPDLTLARKLEKFLKIELVEQVEVESGGSSGEKKSGEGLTLGDLIKLK